MLQLYAFLYKQPKRTAGSWQTEGRNFENRNNIGKMLTVLSLNYDMPVGYEAGCRSIHQRLFDFIDNTAFVTVPFKPTRRKSPNNCNLDSFAKTSRGPKQSANVQVHVRFTPGFLSSRQNWVPPPPPTWVQGGETHSLAGEGVGVPDSDEGTDTLVLYLYYNSSTRMAHK
jgi:hypothetical protein